MPRSSKLAPSTKQTQAQPQPQLRSQTNLQPQAKPLTEIVKQGFAFGVGNSIGNRIISGLFPNINNSKTTEYEQCMKDHDKSFCEQYNT
jgi:hypothetical protein